MSSQPSAFAVTTSLVMLKSVMLVICVVLYANNVYDSNISQCLWFSFAIFAN